MPPLKGFSNTGSFTAGMLGREGERRTTDAQLAVDRSAKSASAAADETARRQSRQTAMSAAGMQAPLVWSTPACCPISAAQHVPACRRGYAVWGLQSLQPEDGSCPSFPLHCIATTAGGWGLAECCVAVGALATITSLLRNARPALPRLLPDSAQAINKFYTRTVDAAGRLYTLRTWCSCRRQN